MSVRLLDLPKVKSIEHKLEPTWGSDAGRNSNSGKYSGTFVGYFDTINVEIGKTNQNEMTTIRNQIDVPIVELTFTDSKTGKEKTEEFYGTTISAKTNNTKGIYEPFSFSLKAIERRDDM